MMLVFLRSLLKWEPLIGIGENVMGLMRYCRALKMPAIKWYLCQAEEMGVFEIYDVKLVIQDGKHMLCHTRNLVWLVFLHRERCGHGTAGQRRAGVGVSRLEAKSMENSTDGTENCTHAGAPLIRARLDRNLKRW